MNGKYVDARVCKSNGRTTNILIKAGSTVVKTAFSELAPCMFPAWTSYPIHVEIPSSGARDFVVGPFSNCTRPKAENGDFANTVKFPVYTSQEVSDLRDFEDLPAGGAADDNSAGTLSRVPVIAIGAAVSGQVDGEKRVETHCVLPVWHDNTAVLVTLNWYEGEPAEGTPNPEWHMRASTGMPLEPGLQKLEEVAHLSENTTDCLYRLTVSPWQLAAQILGSTGIANPHRIWQHEWQFADLKEFRAALSRLKDGLMGLGVAERPAVAEEQVS